MAITTAWPKPITWPSIVTLPGANFFGIPKIDWINEAIEYKQIDLKPNIYGPSDLKPMVANKLAATDPKWNNKVAWSVVELLKRQQSIETYSLEVEILFDIVTTAVSQSINKELSNQEVDFIANFGSPVYGNRQNISISVMYPITLAIRLERKLVDGKLTHVAYAASSFTQLPPFNGKPITPSKSKNSFTIEFMEDDVTKVDVVPKKRKIKI